MVQWGEYLAASGTLFPFFLYAFSGIVVTVVFVILIFKEEGGASRSVGSGALKCSGPTSRAKVLKAVKAG
jgi:hypothetical protein